jgi:hypothetical protein
LLVSPTTALRSFLVCLLVTLFASPSFAITDEEIFRNFRFNFANPGARALGMGGAFIAIANDATAMQANPSRLAVLRLPEIFAEVRNRTTEDSGADTGRFFIDPAGSVNPAASLTLNSTIEPESQTTPSVISFVWPFEMRRALTVGFSRQEVLSVESDVSNSFTLTPLNSSLFQNPQSPTEFVLTNAQGSIDASLVQYSLSAGYQLTRDLFVGGSVTYGELDMSAASVSNISDPYQLSVVGNIDPRFQQPIPQPFVTTSIDDSDTDVKWNLGLFWKLNDYVSFGTVYKKGVKMNLDETVSQSGSLTRTEEVSFNVPDSAGFGVSYRPFPGSQSTSRNLLFALDLNYVENNDLVDGFTAGLNILTNPSFVEDVEFTADNKTEVHVGAEYYLPAGPTTLFFRGGFYTDPDNTVRATRTGHDVVSGAGKAIIQGGAFPGRSDETHWTAGLGLSWSSLEFAMAYDNSDIETQSLFSVIYRFKR